MNNNERRLLLVFVALATVLGGALLCQRLMKWERRLDRAEQQLALTRMESEALLGEAPLWGARADWIARTQPAAASGPEASKSLRERLRKSAQAAGLEITKTQIDEEQQTEFYRQFGVTFTVRGQLPALFGWIHATLEPHSFFVVPLLRISPEKGESQEVTAQIRFQRRYLPEFASSSTPKAGNAP